jgi:outer membrane protein assembly factor BamB
VDSLPPELVRLRDEGRLTVRALWAWRLVPELTPAIALEFRELGHDLLDAELMQIRNLLAQSDAGQLQLSEQQRKLLGALVVWMEPDQESQSDPDQEAQAALPPDVAAEPVGSVAEVAAGQPEIADVAAEEPVVVDVEPSGQDLGTHPAAIPVVRDAPAEQASSGATGGEVPPQAADALYRGNLARTGVFSGPAPQQTPTLVWKFELTKEYCRDPVVAGDTAYIGSVDGHMYAIDLVRGELRWKFNAEDWVDYSPAVSAGTVYFGSVMGDTDRSGHLFAVDAATGTEKWRFESPRYGVSSSPAIVDGTVYFGAGDHHLYALNALTGKKEWSFDGSVVFSSSSSQVGTPAIADSTVYFGHGNRLTAVELGAEAEKWTFSLANVSTCSVVSDGVVYFGADIDFHIYAVDLLSGQEKWKFNAGRILYPPAVHDGVVYAVSFDNLHALEAQTGAVQWTVNTVRESLTAPVIIDDTIIVGAGKFLLALDRASGQEKWRFEAGDAITTPAISDGVVYFWSEDGYFYAVR